MDERFSRTARLIGRESVERLNQCTVAVFGLGGVGAAAVEGLARGGIGGLLLIDRDVVDITNLNRQLLALTSNLGRPKAEVMRDRVLDIHPAARVRAQQIFVHHDTMGEIDLSGVDYIVDAMDNLTAKLLLAETAEEKGIPLISSMGTGNKLDPTRFEVADIYETSICPLARIMRKELRKRGIDRLKVVYSREPALCPDGDPRLPASISFVPPVAGMILAGEVIKDLLAGA
ncbi:MAG: tRNA threonylcarbamoyladenosine dehydratase [Candidatus Howiella sp.]|jgi:tRNA A37 threonylcarbamoyladenosine dehydratase